MTIKRLKKYFAWEISKIRGGWIEVVEDDNDDTDVATCIYSLDLGMEQHHYKFVVDLNNKCAVVGDIYRVIPKPRPWIIGAPPLSRKEKWLDPDNNNFPMSFYSFHKEGCCFTDNMINILFFIEKDMKKYIDYHETMPYRHELEKHYKTVVKL